MKKVIVAIDGPAAAGKSTVAKAVAKFVQQGPDGTIECCNNAKQTGHVRVRAPVAKTATKSTTKTAAPKAAAQKSKKSTSAKTEE